MQCYKFFGYPSGKSLGPADSANEVLKAHQVLPQPSLDVVGVDDLLPAELTPPTTVGHHRLKVRLQNFQTLMGFLNIPEEVVPAPDPFLPAERCEMRLDPTHRLTLIANVRGLRVNGHGTHLLRKILDKAQVAMYQVWDSAADRRRISTSTSERRLHSEVGKDANTVESSR